VDHPSILRRSRETDNRPFDFPFDRAVIHPRSTLFMS
jgi:hypothetical protein